MNRKIKNIIQIPLVLLFLLITCASSIAQPADAKVDLYNGKQCYVHKIEKGNTLYGISRTYKVEIETITNANPKSSEKLKPGDILYIPVPADRLTLIKPTDSQIKPVDTLKPVAADTTKPCKRHTVKQGETLYGISRQHNITVAEIEKANLFLQNSSLHPGMELCIPGKAVSDNTVNNQQQTLPELKVDSLHKHTVQKGETLYSISKRFMLSQNDIKEANKGLPNGLRTGDVIIIPLYKITDREVLVKLIPTLQSPDTSAQNTPQLKEKYKIVFLIPFFLDINASVMSKGTSLKPAELHGPTRNAIQFYMGAKTAIDSLKKAGLNADIFFYDTAKDTVRLQKLLTSGKLDDADLIIGPFYSTTVQMTVAFASEKNIPVILPVPQNNKVLLNNPHVVKAIASISSKIEGMAEFIVTSHPGANVVLLNSKRKDDEDAYELFRHKYNELVNSGKYPSAKPLKETESTGSSQGLKGNMSKSDLNILVAPSKDITFVSSIVTRLVAVRNSYDYYIADFCLFGLDDWEKFNTFDLTYKHRVKLHMAAATFIDYDTLSVNRYIRNFRQQYKTDPEEFAFLGFDVSYTFIAGLMNYGTGLIAACNNMQHEGLSMTFRLEQVGEGNGMENRGVQVLRYDDWDLKKAKGPDDFRKKN